MDVSSVHNMAGIWVPLQSLGKEVLMCRLLGYVTPRTATLAEVVDGDQLTAFTSLARMHRDGWGVGRTPAPGVPPVVRTATTGAADDPDFLQEAKATAARAAIVHLRWATTGLPVQPENTHPFLADGIAFAHNGNLMPAERIQALLAPEVRATLVGTTDSERYFALVRQHRRSSPDLPSAVLAAVRELRAVYPRASMNALVLDDEHLVAVRASAHSGLSPEDVAACAVADMPGDHQEDYFALRWTTRPDGAVVVGSTGFDGGTWDALPPESVTGVRLRDASATTVPVVPA